MPALLLVFANVPHPDYITGTKLIFVLGLTNLAVFFLILLMCRCVPRPWRLRRLMGLPFYRRLFACHCYFWYALGLSLGAHVYIAWTTYGWPFR